MQFINVIGLILTVLVLNVRAQDPAGFCLPTEICLMMNQPFMLKPSR